MTLTMSETPVGHGSDATDDTVMEDTRQCYTSELNGFEEDPVWSYKTRGYLPLDSDRALFKLP
jgi:hypothetical protein